MNSTCSSEKKCIGVPIKTLLVERAAAPAPTRTNTRATTATNEPVHRFQPIGCRPIICAASAVATDQPPSLPAAVKTASSNGIHRMQPPMPYIHNSNSSPPSTSTSVSSTPPSRSLSISSAPSTANASSSNEFSPMDFFAKQSARSSKIAGKRNTLERFRRSNQPIGDLLLADHSNVQLEIIERSCGSMKIDNANEQNRSSDGTDVDDSTTQTADNQEEEQKEAMMRKQQQCHEQLINEKQHQKPTQQQQQQQQSCVAS